MQPARDSKPGTFDSPRKWGLAWAIMRLCLGLIVLSWIFVYGVYDDSSLGEVWLMMALAVSLALVLPATVTLVRAMILSTRTKTTS
jgi:hypothetical protein